MWVGQILWAIGSEQVAAIWSNLHLPACEVCPKLNILYLITVNYISQNTEIKRVIL